MPLLSGERCVVDEALHFGTGQAPMRRPRCYAEFIFCTQGQRFCRVAAAAIVSPLHQLCGPVCDRVIAVVAEVVVAIRRVAAHEFT